MSIESLQIQITAINEAGKVLNQVKSQIESLKKTEARFDSLGKGLTRVGATATAAMTVPIVGGLYKATQATIQFESAMNEVNKALNLGGVGTKQFKAMEGRIKNLALQTGQMPQDVAAGMTELGKLGVADIGDQLERMSQLTSALGVNFEMTAGEASNAAGKLINVYGLMDKAGKVNIERFQKLTDTIDYLGDVGLTNGRDLTNVLGRIGGPAKNFGLLETQAAAFGAALLNTGTAPEVVATAINSMLPKLQAATRQTKKFQQGLAEVGFGAAEFEAMVKKDAAGALVTFFQSLNKLEDKTGVIQQMFGAGSDSSLIAQFAGDTSLLTKAFEDIKKVGDGRSLDQFRQNMETTQGGLQKLKATFAVLGLEIGAALLPPLNAVLAKLTPLVQRLAKFAQANPKITQMAVAFAMVAAAIGPVLIMLGQMAQGVAAVMGIMAALQRIKLAGALASIFGGGGGAAGGIAGIGAAIAGIGFGPILAGVALLAAGAYLVARNWDSIKPVFASIGEAIQTGLQSAMEFMQGFGQGFMEAIGPALPGLMESLSGFGDSLQNLWTATQPLIEGVGAFMGALQEMSVALSPLMTFINPLIGYLPMLSQGFSGVGEAASGMGQTVGYAIGLIVQGVMRIASSTMNVVSSFNNMVSQIGGAINGLVGSMFKAGAAIIQNLINGIRSKVGEAMAAIRGVADAIRSALPGSEPKWAGSPLRNLSAAGSAIIGNTAAGITPDPLLTAMSSALAPVAAMLPTAGTTTAGTVGASTAPAPVTPAQTASTGGMGGGISVSVVVNAAGSGGQEIGDALEERLTTLMPRLMAGFENNKQRVAYG